MEGDDDLAKICNGLLAALHVPHRLKNWRDITSHVFVLLYEGLTGEPLGGIIRKTKNESEEVKNVQHIIDTLQNSVLKTSLSHINGERVVRKRKTAVSNLLEIFSGLFEYIVHKIDDEISKDGVENDSNGELEGISEGALERLAEVETSGSISRELKDTADYIALADTEQSLRSTSADTRELIASAGGELPSRSTTQEDTNELIALGEVSNSRDMRDVSTSHRDKSSRNTIETADESDSPLRLTLSDNSLERDKKFDHIGLRPKPSDSVKLKGKIKDSKHHTYTHHLYHHIIDESSKDSLTKSLPLSISDERLNHSLTKSTGFSSKEGSIENLQTNPTFAEILRKYDLLPENKVQESRSLDSSLSKSIPVGSRETFPAKHKREIPERIEAWKLKDTKSSTWKAEINSRLEAAHRAAGLPMRMSPTEETSLKHISDRPDIDQDPEEEKNSCIHDRLERMNKSLEELVQAFGNYSARFSKIGSENIVITDSLVEEEEEEDDDDDGDAEDDRGSNSCTRQTNMSAEKRDSENSSKLTLSLDNKELTYSDGQEADISSFERETKNYGRKLDKKVVRFDDKFDKRASGNLGPYRKQFLGEEKKMRRHKEMIGDEYADALDNFKAAKKDILSKSKSKGKETEKKYKKSALKKPKTTTSATIQNKYSKPRLRSKSSNRTHPILNSRKRSSSESPVRQVYTDDPQKLLGMLLKEFPHLDLSSDVLHELWRSAAHQATLMTSIRKNTGRDKVLEQIEEAERKQKILLDIMRKEMNHRVRMKEIDERRHREQTMKKAEREKRQQSARARRYYNECHTGIKSKLLKARTKEETLFKRLFKEGLEIQKDRLRELRKYAKEQRSERAKKQKNEMDSLENFYKDQFEMLADSFDKEKKDFQVREGAQSRALKKMKVEMRKKLEGDIKTLHAQLVNDNDDEYWRNVDVDRIRLDMQRAPFTARV